MTIQYKLVNTSPIQPAVTIVGQNIYIPMDESNTDYQAYLKWVAEGNTPEAAE